jgi:DNA-binding NarL/FixJ family response regulator
VAGEVSEEVGDCADHVAFLRSTRASLANVIPSDLVWHIELDFQEPRASLFGLADAEALASRFTSVLDVQPWIGSRYRPGGGCAPAVTRVPRHMMDVTRWVFEASATYADVAESAHAHSQTVVTHDARARSATGWAMVRLAGDYSEADTELAGALQPMLALLESAYAARRSLRVQLRHDIGGAADGREVLSEAAERYGLTARELEVIELLCRGLTAQHMAHVLRITEATTRKHLQNIYAKLGVHDRLLVAARVRSLGLDHAGHCRDA